MYKQSGRTIPKFSDDDVTDYKVLEALTLKALKQEAEDHKKQEREAWKKDRKGLAEKTGNQ